MKIVPTFEIRINNGFLIKIFNLILTFSLENYNLGFFILNENSYGYVFYKIHNKFNWKVRKYQHKAITENIKKQYSMGNWFF
jgi:hypothetical protein